MRRKNLLFANVPKGAQASTIIYSLVETAKENDLDPDLVDAGGAKTGYGRRTAGVTVAAG